MEAPPHNRNRSGPFIPGAGLHLCLCGGDARLIAALRLCCPPPHQLTEVPAPETDGRAGMDDAAWQLYAGTIPEVDAVVRAWDLQEAPWINKLGYILRKRGTPFLVICGGSQVEQTAALLAAADDVITIPLHLPMLKARLVAYHRMRAAAAGGASPAVWKQEPLTSSRWLRRGLLELDLKSRWLHIRGSMVELTPRESGLLEFLMERAGEVCSRDEILDQVWGINFDTGTNMVDVYMSFLRSKLEEA